MSSYVFTSESVSEVHPDKICDQISDALLDAYLACDPFTKVAIETVVTTQRVILVGEVSHLGLVSKHSRADIVRKVIREIGYAQEGFHWQTCQIEDWLHDQSADIAQGVERERGVVVGAGDQGIMFGYACAETPSYMPAPLYYAHRVLESLREGRLSGALSQLGPDAKTQLSVRYEDGSPVGLACLVVSNQHSASLKCEEIKALIKPYVEKALPQGWMCDDAHFYVNPTGQFITGGPTGDSGLTGRKIIVDTYGGRAPHGGGAFSGKDPTKVDRSAAYMARYLAKNIVAAGLARVCVLQLSYVIGMDQPVSIYLNLQSTGRVDEKQLADFLMQNVDLTPQGILNTLDLRRPIYQATASYGHFGREPQENGAFSWEKLDLVEMLVQEFSSENKISVKA